MPANEGSQTLSIKYLDDVDSAKVNERFLNTRDTGIYEGGYITITDGATGAISLSPVVCEIGDGSYQVRAQTTTAVTKTLVETTGEYLVLRWTYTGANTDFMEILVSNNPQSTDLIVGQGVWTAGTLTSITYADRKTPVNMWKYLQVVPTSPASSSVRVRPGTYMSGSGPVSITDQSVSLASYSAGEVVYIYINSAGAVAHSTSSSSYLGNVLLASITIPVSGTIAATDISDVRSFLSPTYNSQERTAYIKIIDKKSNGTDGQSMSGNSWNTRELTDEISDTHNLATLSSNQITLLAGTYECSIVAPVTAAATHVSQLYNVTDGDTEVLGLGTAGAASSNETHDSPIRGQFTITTSKVFDIRTYVSDNSKSGISQEALSGVDNIYTIAEFWRIGYS